MSASGVTCAGACTIPRSTGSAASCLAFSTLASARQRYVRIAPSAVSETPARDASSAAIFPCFRPGVLPWWNIPRCTISPGRTTPILPSSDATSTPSRPISPIGSASSSSTVATDSTVGTSSSRRALAASFTFAASCSAAAATASAVVAPIAVATTGSPPAW